VAQATRARGPSDTVWVSRFERNFVRTLAVALVLHLPFLPLPIFEWARLALFGGAGDYDDPDAQAIVPIDLDLLGKDLVSEPTAAAPPAAPGLFPSLSATPPPPKPPPPKPPPPPAETPDAGPPPPPPPIKDPVSAAGAVGKIAAKDPNVQVLVSGSVLRKHEMGAWMAGLLVQIPEWRAFFEGSPVDPVRDFNHLLITAPYLKKDTSKVVAVMEYNLSPDLARDAIDRVLRRTNGVWLEDAPVTTARAKVGGVPRLFALLPEHRLLVVLPADAMDQLARLKQAKPFRSSAEGVVVSMLTPAGPFKDFLPLPPTLKWLRFAVTPTADGGADLAIDVGDRSADEARDHAAVLTRLIEARRKVSVLGLAEVEIIDPVTFIADRDVIRARVHLQPQKLRLIMAWVSQKAEERARARQGTEH
jgi:hypothetical protein